MRREPAPGDEETSTSHTEEHTTVDTETGDRDPEVEVQEPPRRDSLAEASKRVEGVEDH